MASVAIYLVYITNILAHGATCPLEKKGLSSSSVQKNALSRRVADVRA